MVYNEQEKQVTFEKCITFLNSIGIPTSFGHVDNDSFLPGFLIDNGAIVIDADSLQYPGDLLHEAGHIAVVSGKDRVRLSEKDIIKRRDREAEEVMAIAWSYAACMHLDIDPSYVFHKDGYRGGSNDIMESCDKNEYVGMLMLQGLGMTSDGSKRKANVMPYPHMIKWLRD